jgi:hypothetical protein
MVARFCPSISADCGVQRRNDASNNGNKLQKNNKSVQGSKRKRKSVTHIYNYARNVIRTKRKECCVCNVLFPVQPERVQSSDLCRPYFW